MCFHVSTVNSSFSNKRPRNDAVVSRACIHVVCICMYVGVRVKFVYTALLDVFASFCMYTLDLLPALAASAAASRSRIRPVRIGPVLHPSVSSCLPWSQSFNSGASDRESPSRFPREAPAFQFFLRDCWSLVLILRYKYLPNILRTGSTV